MHLNPPDLPGPPSFTAYDGGPCHFGTALSVCRVCASHASAALLPLLSQARALPLQAPISVPTSSPLRLMVSFSDGTERDFTNDTRTAIRVSGGSGLCVITTGGCDGGPAPAMQGHLHHHQPSPKHTGST
jgi:hypothetical protein